MFEPSHDYPRFASFIAIFAAMALWEIAAPRRALAVRKTPRWLSNVGLIILNTAVIRLAIPVTLAGVGQIAQEKGWGLLNQIDLPVAIETAMAVIVLDLAIYLQHVMFHAVPALWRLHMVHHADLDFDVTTGLRFHMLEILLSTLIKLSAILVLGPSALAVLIFEILLNGTSMFNHSNIHLPIGLDRILRLVVVTPDMHRVHHSIVVHETNSNFGFNLPWWDFLLGTYRAQPEAGHTSMTIGVSQARDESRVDRLPGMLLLPFRSQPGDYPINRRS